VNNGSKIRDPSLKVRNWTAFAFRCFPKTIDIAGGLQHWPLDAFQMSLRLADVLRRARIRILGDLHGRKVGDFAWERNCGFETLHELDLLVSAVASAKADASRTSGDCESSAGLPCNGEGSAKNAKRHKKVQNRAGFAIPESVCQLQFDELPITKRLVNVLRSIGARTLGDLQGCTPFELLEYKACGWRTVGEIEQLIERAIAGEFDHSHTDDSAVAAELLILLEQGITKLSPRDRQFLLARIHGLTFKEIGRRVGFTRARAHQIVAEALGTLRKTYGPRIPRLLKIVKLRCLSMVCPLTPALLEQWIGLSRRSVGKADDSSKSFQLSREAQLRLIAALDKNIPWRLESSPKTSGSKKLDLNLTSLGRTLRLAMASEIPNG
jgi:RNA polymerase sigma factor (sigma-70 family)